MFLVSRVFRTSNRPNQTSNKPQPPLTPNASHHPHCRSTLIMCVGNFLILPNWLRLISPTTINLPFPSADFQKENRFVCQKRKRECFRKLWIYIFDFSDTMNTSIFSHKSPSSPFHRQATSGCVALRFGLILILAFNTGGCRDPYSFSFWIKHRLKTQRVGGRESSLQHSIVFPKEKRTDPQAAVCGFLICLFVFIYLFQNQHLFFVLYFYLYFLGFWIENLAQVVYFVWCGVHKHIITQ